MASTNSRNKELRVDMDQLEATISRMDPTFTILDFADEFQAQFPGAWRGLVERYGLYGSGTRYSVLTYLSNRLSSYSRRKSTGLLEPTPTGWKPEEGPFLRRTLPEERGRFGSQWIVVFRKRPADQDARSPG
jgi:hypothetical protein